MSDLECQGGCQLCKVKPRPSGFGLEFSKSPKNPYGALRGQVTERVGAQLKRTKNTLCFSSFSIVPRLLSFNQIILTTTRLRINLIFWQWNFGRTIASYFHTRSSFTFQNITINIVRYCSRRNTDWSLFF
jgi:hypothetical protein